MEVIRGRAPDWILDGDGYGSSDGSSDGSGSSFGFGDGSSDGSGSGFGDGSGYGYGSGSSFGFGYGSSFGSGSGFGDGSGSGYGSGYGDGSGSGSDDGYGSDDEVLLLMMARSQIPKRSLHDPRVLALWKSDADGRPANGGSAEPARPGLVQQVKGPLKLCSAQALHATFRPTRWKGERLWIVALDGEVVGDSEKFGALRREILCEVELGKREADATSGYEHRIVAYPTRRLTGSQ